MMLILRWLILMLMRLMLLRRGGMTADSKCKLLMPIFANCVILRRPPARPYTYTRRCFPKILNVAAVEVDEDDYNFHECTLICLWWWWWPWQWACCGYIYITTFQLVEMMIMLVTLFCSWQRGVEDNDYASAETPDDDERPRVNVHRRQHSWPTVDTGQIFTLRSAQRRHPCCTVIQHTNTESDTKQI